MQDVNMVIYLYFSRVILLKRMDCVCRQRYVSELIPIKKNLFQIMGTHCIFLQS